MGRKKKNQFGEMTNVDFVVDVMSYSNYGGLVQSFIMQGIEAYCNQVIDAEEELLQNDKDLKEQGKMPFIAIDAWVGCAKELKEKLIKRYDG